MANQDLAASGADISGDDLDVLWRLSFQHSKSEHDLDYWTDGMYGTLRFPSGDHLRNHYPKINPNLRLYFDGHRSTTTSCSAELNRKRGFTVI